jgi:hypothetical protein
MNLVQFLDATGTRRVGLVRDGGARLALLRDTFSTHALALDAARQRRPLSTLLLDRVTTEIFSFDDLLAARRVLPPLDHPDPAHCLVAGTGLTHLGSAQARDAMHTKLAAAEHTLSDSMKIFRWGLEGGKPTDGRPPVQPEWFYKGDGSWIIPPEHALEQPAFADDGGEEAEIAGLYVIGDDGTPLRVGFSLGNEFSDHVMEKKNYLYLAHSKLRTCSLGPELYVGELPASIEGRVSVTRGGTEIWSAAFLTGEANMTYTLAGLEHHHFKYARFRRPGDVHVHFFGAAILSFASGLRPLADDVFTVSAPPFSRPLRNPLRIATAGQTLLTPAG